jgi:hypothetical protein
VTFFFYLRWLIFKPELEIIQTTFLTNVQDNWAKNVTSRVITKFFHFWSVPMKTMMFKIIKTNFLTNFQYIWDENILPLECKQYYSIIWFVWPSFWPQMTRIQKWPRNHLNNFSDYKQPFWLISLFPGYLDLNSIIYSVSKVLQYLGYVT